MLLVIAINKMEKKNSKKKLAFGDLDRHIQEKGWEYATNELVATNTNVVYGASGLLEEVTRSKGVEFGDVIKGNS